MGVRTRKHLLYQSYKILSLFQMAAIYNAPFCGFLSKCAALCELDNWYCVLSDW